jgi:mono/diheme cytochrome c family protein
MKRIATIVGVSMLALTAACNREGREVYLAAGCDECHGVDLKGTRTGGPPITGTRKHWSVDELLLYFANPDSVADTNPRLQELRSYYESGMKPLDWTDPAGRRALAKYVRRW